MKALFLMKLILGSLLIFASKQNFITHLGLCKVNKMIYKMTEFPCGCGYESKKQRECTADQFCKYKDIKQDLDNRVKRKAQNPLNNRICAPVDQSMGDIFNVCRSLKGCKCGKLTCSLGQWCQPSNDGKATECRRIKVNHYFFCPDPNSLLNAQGPQTPLTQEEITSGAYDCYCDPNSNRKPGGECDDSIHSCSQDFNGSRGLFYRFCRDSLKFKRIEIADIPAQLEKDPNLMYRIVTDDFKEAISPMVFENKESFAAWYKAIDDENKTIDEGNANIDKENAAIDEENLKIDEQNAAITDQSKKVEKKQKKPKGKKTFIYVIDDQTIVNEEIEAARAQGNPTVSKRFFGQGYIQASVAGREWLTCRHYPNVDEEYAPYFKDCEDGRRMLKQGIVV